jgi:hypothetical protein
MPKMVCVKCEVEFQCEKNGVKVIELMNHNQSPYKIWDTDKWKCPICGIEVIAGFAQAPLMEHYQEGFNNYIMECQARGDEIVYDKELPL